MKKRIFKNISIFGIILFSLSFLTSCEPIKGEQIIEKLFPNVWALIAQLISFLILVIGMIFLVYKPVKKYLTKRREILDNEVKETEENKNKALNNVLTSEKEIASSKQKAKTIINNAEISASKKHDEIIENARIEAKDIIKDANIAADKIKEDAKLELKNQIVDTALKASKKVLEREVSEKDNEKIIRFVELTNTNNFPISKENIKDRYGIVSYKTNTILEN